MRLVYFAKVREMIGQSEEAIALPANVHTVADLMMWLRERGGSYEHAMRLENLCLAVNQEFADWDTVLSDMDEVAFFPPVTGG